MVEVGEEGNLLASWRKGGGAAGWLLDWTSAWRYTKVDPYETSVCDYGTREARQIKKALQIG